MSTDTRTKHHNAGRIPWNAGEVKRLKLLNAELLAALQALSNLISDDESRYEAWQEEMEAATAAIRKAEGDA